MILTQTKLSKDDAEFPTLFDFETIAMARGLIQSREDLYAFKRLDSGVKGEEKVVRLLKEYGKDHWKVLQNTWMDYYGAFESDLILLTNHCCYIFEIKNYTGKFVYENGICTINGRKISSNPIQQARRAFLNLQSICSEAPESIPIKGAIIFIGENNQVHIHSDIEDIDVLQLTDLHEYIQVMIQEERDQTRNTLPSKKLIKHFEKYETANPFKPQPISPEKMTKSRVGIHCAKCHSYDITINRQYIICKCGLHEPREEAIIRTICEYGVLNFDRNFSIGEIMKFIDGQASYTYLQKVLSKHFNSTQKTKYTFYHNKKLPYHKIYNEFDIKLPIKFISKRGREIIHILN